MKILNKMYLTSGLKVLGHGDIADKSVKITSSLT